jgi:hypothetical protein
MNGIQTVGTRNSAGTAAAGPRRAAAGGMVRDKISLNAFNERYETLTKVVALVTPCDAIWAIANGLNPRRSRQAVIAALAVLTASGRTTSGRGCALSIVGWFAVVYRRKRCTFSRYD